MNLYFLDKANQTPLDASIVVLTEFLTDIILGCFIAVLIFL